MKHRRPLALLVHRVSLILTLALFAFLALFGTQLFRAQAHAATPSYVRVIHASPFVGTADVFVDGAKLLSSFAFGVVTDYVAVPPGPHKVQIALVGKGIGAAALTQTLAVTPGVAYTVAATGATLSTLKLQVFIDNNLVTSGAAKVRLYQLSPNLGSVDLTAGGNTLIQGVAYQQASQYHVVTAGPYTFNVNANATNTSLPLSATLKANTVTSIFAVGMVNGSPSIELVPAQASGLPGLPGTGSDPNAPSTVQPIDFPAPLLWLLGALALIMLGVSVFTRRLAAAR